MKDFEDLKVGDVIYKLKFDDDDFVIDMTPITITYLEKAKVGTIVVADCNGCPFSFIVNNHYAEVNFAHVSDYVIVCWKKKWVEDTIVDTLKAHTDFYNNMLEELKESDNGE